MFHIKKSFHFTEQKKKIVEFDLNNPLNIRSFTGNKTIDVVQQRKPVKPMKKNRCKACRRVKTHDCKIFVLRFTKLLNLNQKYSCKWHSGTEA